MEFPNISKINGSQHSDVAPEMTQKAR